MNSTHVMKKANLDNTFWGISCFFVAGFILFLWIPFMEWEITYVRITIEAFMLFSGAIGALDFILLGLGIKLILRK